MLKKQLQNFMHTDHENAGQVLYQMTTLRIYYTTSVDTRCQLIYQIQAKSRLQFQLLYSDQHNDFRKKLKYRK